MANGFGSFYVGNSGLQYAQNALNVTANNLANVNTVGYVREQVRFADRHYITRNDPTSRTNMQQSGLGVSIGDVAHARDIFLDKAFRLETGRQNFYEACYDVTSYIEDMFQELDGEEFKQSISDLWIAVQEFAKDPADSTNQNLLLQKGELILSRGQSLYTNLQNYQSNINQQIKDEVNRMNEIGKRVYQLNLDIQKIESGHVETAMTLRDERDALIDELATYGKVEVREDSTGFLYVEVENVSFVGDGKCNEIGLNPEKGTGFYTPYWPQLSNANAEEYYKVFKTDEEISTLLNNDIGSVKALLLQRGETYGRYGDLDDDRYSKIEDCACMETQAQIDYLLRNIVMSMNDIFCPNVTAQESLNLEEGDTIIAHDAQGNEYEINWETIVLDKEKASVGTDGELPPQELFVRVGADRYTKVTDDEGNTYYIYNEEYPGDTSTWYALGSISINPELAKTITKMPAFTANGQVDYAMGKKLSDAWQENIMYINPYDSSPCNFENYYNKILSNLGTKGSVYDSANKTLTDTATSIDNQRQQITGVSSDEELTHMIKFQSAYNAASRYITVINQMTELIVALI